MAELRQGVRITDPISLGVVAKTFPVERVKAVLAATGKQSQRRRDLAAPVMVYYAIAWALYLPVSCREVLRCLLAGIHGLSGPENELPVASKAGISQARTRRGWEPLRPLHDEVVGPMATRKTRGAGYGHWRLVSLDGSTLDVADTKENQRAFGRPGANRGKSAYPQLRFVSLVENGTHGLFASQMAEYARGETRLAQQVLPALRPGRLCLADRQFLGFSLWEQARATRADLLWRIKKNLRLPCEQRLPEGSYLSRIYPSEKDRRHHRQGLRGRGIDYRLRGVAGAEPLYRLVTTLLDPETAPAPELAALYHERWEIETAWDELKTHLRGAQIVLRSKTPNFVRQEFYGFLMAHFAIRGLLHEAALQADLDPDRLSFLHAVRVVRRQWPLFVAVPPQERTLFHQGVLREILQERVVSSRTRHYPRGVKRKMSHFPLRPRRLRRSPPLAIRQAIRIMKRLPRRLK